MSDRSLTELEEFFLALSDGTRLRLLSLMQNEEVSVGYLSEKLNQSQPKISRHLAYLRSAGLVETRRDGKWIYYHIATSGNSFASRSLKDALSWTGSITGDMPGCEAAGFSEIADEPQISMQMEPQEHWVGFEDESCEEEHFSNEIEVYLL